MCVCSLLVVFGVELYSNVLGCDNARQRLPAVFVHFPIFSTLLLTTSVKPLDTYNNKKNTDLQEIFVKAKRVRIILLLRHFSFSELIFTPDLCLIWSGSSCLALSFFVLSLFL